MLTIHILVGVLGLFISTALLVSPSRNKFNYSAVLLVITLATGTALVFLNPAYMVRSCIVGLAYTAFVAGALYVGNKKLALYTIRKK